MDNQLTSLEHRKYSKQLEHPLIGIKGQEKLKSLRVLIIGAGGLGIPVLQYLSSMGVGVIGIMDNDKIEEKNLPGQVLYSLRDLGKHKTIVARERLREINSDVQYKIHNICLNSQNAIGFFQEYDFIIDATDMLETKYIINDAAVILKKRWVFTCSNNFDAKYAVFDGKNGPTFRCMIEQLPHLIETIEHSVELALISGIAGTLAATEILKQVIGVGHESLGDVVSLNMETNNFLRTSIEVVPKNLTISSM